MDKKPVSKGKRIAAIVAIVILVLMYVLSLFFAVFDVPNWKRWFFASMGATIILPAFLWLNIFLYDRLVGMKKKNAGEEESNE